MPDAPLIRRMRQPDARAFTDAEVAKGWHASVEKYETRLRHQAEGKAVALVAECGGQVAGYVSVYPNPERGAFANRGIPEIVDLGVLERFRGRGVGGALMDAAESVASEYADAVCLAVGLHSGYGAAQRLYVKRGYVPDGSGVWSSDHVLAPYAACRNDDDLVLYLIKRFRTRVCPTAISGGV